MSLIQVAEAEPIRTISGFGEDGAIVIRDNGSNKITLYDGDTGKKSEHFDSRVKTYNSGGFSMKNHESGIIVFGHPINDDGQYKLLVLTSDKVYRFIGVSGIIEELNEEPSSSVGRDISRWDIPTTGRSDYKYVKPVEQHNPDTLDLLFSVPQSVQWLYNLNFDLTAIDTQIKSENDRRLSNVPISVQILNPLMEIVDTWDGTTDNFGVFGDSYYIADNQMIGEYTLKASIEKENYTSISKMVSFFVIPLVGDNSSNACPVQLILNSTQFCVDSDGCVSWQIFNVTSNFCVARNACDNIGKIFNPATGFCEIQ